MIMPLYDSTSVSMFSVPSSSARSKHCRVCNVLRLHVVRPAGIIRRPPLRLSLRPVAVAHGGQAVDDDARLLRSQESHVVRLAHAPDIPAQSFRLVIPAQFAGQPEYLPLLGFRRPPRRRPP